MAQSFDPELSSTPLYCDKVERHVWLIGKEKSCCQRTVCESAGGCEYNKPNESGAVVLEEKFPIEMRR